MWGLPGVRSIGRWLMLAATLVIPAAPSYAAGPTPTTPATLLAEACTILRDDPGAAATFPGAAAYLCQGRQYAEGFCSTRSLGQCKMDTVCALSYGGCARLPCRPEVSVTGCTLNPQQNLVKLIRHFRICQRSGGAWVEDARLRGGRSYGGTCSCMGATVQGAILTLSGAIPRDDPSPVTFYVGERGCVSELALCAEHHGLWITTPPSTIVTQPGSEAGCKLWPHSTWQPAADPYGTCRRAGVAENGRVERKSSCEASKGLWRPDVLAAGLCTFDNADPHAPPFRPYCAIDGVPASWGMLEPQRGFPRF